MDKEEKDDLVFWGNELLNLEKKLVIQAKKLLPTMQIFRGLYTDVTNKELI